MGMEKKDKKKNRLKRKEFSLFGKFYIFQSAVVVISLHCNDVLGRVKHKRTLFRQI
jgi:hypothetical protein